MHLAPHPEWLPETRRRLASLGLPPEWSEATVEAPGLRASRLADCALRVLAEMGLRPEGVFPCPEGGIRFAFASPGRFADVQFLNDGGMTASLSGRTPQSLAAGPDLTATFQTIRSFLAS